MNSWKAFGPGATSEKKVPFSPRRVCAPSIKMSAPRPWPPLMRKLVAFVPVLPEVVPVPPAVSFETMLLSRKMNESGERPPLSAATSSGNSLTCRSRDVELLHRRLGLQHRRALSRDRHRLADLADFELDIDGARNLHGDLDVVDRRGLEARRLDR